MSRAMFDQTLAPRQRSKRSFGTVTFSVLLHAAAVVVVLAWQFTSSIQGLIVASPLPVYVAANPTPPPAVPRPAVPSSVAPTPTLSAPVAPTIPLDVIGSEPPTAISAPFSPIPGIGPIVNNNGDNTRFFSTGVNPVASFTPPAPQPTTVHVGGTIVAPTRLVYVPPMYPSIAQTAHVEGEVTLEATIDEAGNVRNVVVQQSVPLLDRAAIEAVSKWRYSPTRLNGQPVAVIMLVRVKFTLK